MVEDSLKRFQISARTDDTFAEPFFDAKLRVHVVTQFGQRGRSRSQAIGHDCALNLGCGRAQVLWGLQIGTDLVEGLLDRGYLGLLLTTNSDVVDQVDADAIVDDHIVFAVLRVNLLPKLDPAFQAFAW